MLAYMPGMDDLPGRRFFFGGGCGYGVCNTQSVGAYSAWDVSKYRGCVGKDERKFWGGTWN